MKRLLSRLGSILERDPRKDPNAVVFLLLTFGVIAFPIAIQIVTRGSGSFLISQAADAGVYVLLAIGLNVVVGFAGLLDLGYAAFFAIGAYTYAFIASDHMEFTPIHQAIHIPFWIALLVGMFAAAGAGAILGAPTLRLRGDYLAIVTLGFGEIVPRLFRNASTWTSGVNGISALDTPALPIWLNGPWSGDAFAIVQNFKIIDPLAYYVIMAILVAISVLLVNNLRRSRMGRAWMAVREDEVAAAAMGVNTVGVKLLAFSIGAAFSGFAGTFYGAKLSLVSPENFGFTVSITILIMVVLGGIFNVLPDLPQQASDFANSIGATSLNSPSGDWPGLAGEVQRLKYLIFGLILVLTMLLRPQGLLPSRQRAEELQKGVHDDTTIEDVNAETT